MKTFDEICRLILVFWLWLALLPVERTIYFCRSIRHEVVSPRPVFVMILTVIAVLAMPQPLALA